MITKIIGKNTILIFFLVFFKSYNAQIIQIGSGTNVNTITQSSPVNIYYRRTVSQMVYTKAELNAAGKNVSDTIRELGFFVFAKPVYDIPNYTIKIKHTNSTSVNGSLGNSGWTTVKNSFTYSAKTGEWNMIKLDIPFVWNGTQNIGIEICWSQVQPSYDASGQCYIFNSSNGYRYSWTDNVGSSCGQNPTITKNYKPQIRFKFKDYTSWIGSVSTNWFDPLNWDAGVPTFEFDARIPAGTPYMPVINNLGAVCANLTINNGATLTVANNNELSIFGSFKNNGILNSNFSSIIFKGLKASTIETIGLQQFYNLLIENPVGVSLTSGQIDIRNTLQLNAGKFNTGNACTILSDSINTARITEIKNACKYTITMNDAWGDGWNGGYVTLFINGINSGKYFAKTSQTIDTLYVPDGATFTINYTSGAYENENSYYIKDVGGSTIYSSGPPPQVGNVYSTTSACSFINPLSGTITMQRYIDTGATHWRFLTTSTQGTTIFDWKDDFVMTGFPGSHFPNWPTLGNPWSSIYYYNETVPGLNDQGFQKVTNITNTINSGQGLWVWCGDTITGTSPFTIDVTGIPTTGVVSIPVSYTSSGLPDDDGWNMVGNPYPCTVDWDDLDWQKTNINNAIYIWNPNLQQYTSYVAGIGTNGGSNFIASGQAFWVKANNTSPQLISNEKVKANQDVNFIKQSSPSNLLRFTVTHLNAKDEAVVAFNNNATSGFDTYYDAYKIGSVETLVPYIASVNNSIDLSINSQDSIINDLHIPIIVLVNQSANGYIKVEGVKSLSNIYCITLEDLHTGLQHNLEYVDSVACYFSDTTKFARFILHIGAKPTISEIQPSCFGYANGSIVIKGQGAGPWDITWQDLSQNILKNSFGVTSFDTLKNISAGQYIVTLTNSGYCGVFSDTIMLTEPLPIVAAFSCLDTVYLSNGAMVQFNNYSLNANSFLWNFGDGFSSVYTTPTHNYLVEGLYDVVLKAENNNHCENSVSKIVTVLNTPLIQKEIFLQNNTKIYYYENNLVVEISGLNSHQINITVYNQIGQAIFCKDYTRNGKFFRENINLSVAGGNLLMVVISESNASPTVFKIPVIK